jgi:hypothetical protein
LGIKNIQTTGEVTQEQSKKYKHLEMCVLMETFEIDYAVVDFNTTQLLSTER